MSTLPDCSNVIGLVPAAGLAARIAPLPGSKELYPIGFRRLEGSGEPRPKVVCHYLLEAMQLAGITRAFMVLRQGKWDIPGYLGDGSFAGMRLAYLMMGLPYGAPYTLDQAYPFVAEAIVALGFPDIIFQPADGYVKLLERQRATGADVVLGLFPTADPRATDMVEVADDGRVVHLEIKPPRSRLHHTWGLAVWTPAFTGFLHNHLASLPLPPEREVFVGNVIQAAIERGLRVEGIVLSSEPYLDIGTPENLAAAVRRFAT